MFLVFSCRLAYLVQLRRAINNVFLVDMMRVREPKELISSTFFFN